MSNTADESKKELKAMKMSSTSPYAYPSPITPSKTRIGWIGIGVMGFAMASRLVSAGYSLTIYARNPSKANAVSLLSLGAQLADSPADVGRSSDIVFTMLGNPQDVGQIVLNETSGVLYGLRPKGVIVDHTSSHPDLAKEIFKAANIKDCWAVDAPVSGGDLGAKNGNLTIFASGERNIVSWLSPLFHIMSSKVTYMGGPGSGQICKIANQIVVGANLLGLSEALFFAEKSGLNKSHWMEAVRRGAGGCMVMDIFGQRMIDRDFKAGGFAQYMVKDMGMGLDSDPFVVMPGASLTKQLFASMLANGDEKLGTQGLITVIERINGI